MKTLYFDCFAGASGDMILGALVSAGVDARLLIEQLSRLNVEGFDVSFETVDRSGISATRAHVQARDERQHRHLSDILKIIEASSLTESVKERAAKIFTRLGEAEARVHNVALEQIHFHEVGALDAIVDVVGACIGFELLGVEKFMASPLHVGSGTVEMAHGRFPVPPPAVVELLRDAPIYATDIKGELMTPTGAAIISSVCEDFGPLPALRVARTGYGAGAREYENFPNVLRVFIGESAAANETEKALVVETNIDDCSPQLIGHVMERALAAGALDCYFTPVQMKKNRPGVLVTILCRPPDRETMFELLFSETTTIGVRCYEVERRTLDRVFVSVQTSFGAVSIKVARLNGRVVNATPEFEECRAAALRAGVPLREVEVEAREVFMRLGIGQLESR
ncbi:MAG: nickel pincer cofactor biosynthesis protein LarC [Pyrinomonadaceae bacterium]|nr:nickel pincer cofactor biosynthesis protein LarC [Pyrinomonadaceae bacterium]